MTFNKPPKYITDDKEKKLKLLLALWKFLTKMKRKELELQKKEALRLMSLRLPISLLDDLKEISHITGVSVNAICIEILRPAIKKKLKELIDEL